MFIDLTSHLEKLCDEIRQSGAPLCFDTEFAGERRYRPALFLVQVGVSSPDYSVEAIIDPLRVDLDPFLELVADPKIEKVLHAGSQDLQILWDRFGCAAQNIFDTQIAAAFLGFGHQIGYADLARRVGNAPELSKDFQFSDWSARPLSKEQTEYALDDVRYLPAIHTFLKNELIARGRLAWAKTEFQAAEEKSREETPPEELYKKLNTNRLTRRQLGTLQELAITRDEIAQGLDKPPTFVLPDTALLQLAKQPPKNAHAFRASRGVPPSANEWAPQLLAATKRAAQIPEENLPQLRNGKRPDPRVDDVTTLLGIIASQHADQEEISRNYLAPREQIRALASWSIEREGPQAPPPDLPLLSGWRGELIGTRLLDLLEGKLALQFNPETKELEINPTA